jgi:hypothetical protein
LRFGCKGGALFISFGRAITRSNVSLTCAVIEFSTFSFPAPLRRKIAFFAPEEIPRIPHQKKADN